MTSKRSHSRLAMLALTALLGLAGLGLNLTPAHAADGPSIFVFLPNDMRARAFEKLLTTAMPGVDITVFGRLKDFQNNIKKAPPDAVLTMRAVIDQQKGVSAILQGAAGGKTQESYVLISVDQPASLADKPVIGVVDILGRKKMPSFVSEIVNTKTKVKRVAKPEDLLSLLQFKMVDAILLPKAGYDQLKSKTELKLVVSDAPGRVFLPAVGFLSTNHKDTLASAVKKLDGEVSKIIRVSSWRAN